MSAGATFDTGRLASACEFLGGLVRVGHLPAVGLCVGRGVGEAITWFAGAAGPEHGAPAVGPETLWLAASLTKPLTVTAALILLERGAFTLDDPIATYLPEFTGAGKPGVRLRHLMTHTSGLPDMPPNNLALRAAHAPLDAFVADCAAAPLLFPPGTAVRYQSAGTALLGELVRRVSGQTLAAFLDAEVFGPLGMRDTSLGARPGTLGRVAQVRLDPSQRDLDWNWNSPYWLELGAPWGGLITTPADYGRFCRAMLGGGTLDGTRLLSRATVRAMTRNQLNALPGLPEPDRRCRPWGLGWRLNWPGHSAHFGDLLGPRVFGHWGATGTLAWVDPEADLFLALFTTEPSGDHGPWLARGSNALAAATL